MPPKCGVGDVCPQSISSEMAEFALVLEWKERQHVMAIT